MTVRGTREVLFQASAPTIQVPPPGGGKVIAIYDEAVEDLTRWSLAYEDPDLEALFGAPPLVALVNLLSSVTGESQVFFDAVLLPDVDYVLTTDVLGSERSTTFRGPRRERRPDPQDGALLFADIDAPLVRADGPGGDYTRSGAADFAISGGRATVEKLIWHRLFTPRGSLDWAPGYGSSLRLKEMAPRDLRAEETRLRRLVEDVPGVSRATVSVLFRDDHAVVQVRAVTDFGELVTERRLS